MTFRDTSAFTTLDGANMGMSEDFEKWARKNRIWFTYDEAGRKAVYKAWRARQPEIDALGECLRHEQQANLRLELENGELKAENERLRKLYDDAMCDCPGHSLPECSTCGKVIASAQ
jgi:hypothetical protein